MKIKFLAFLLTFALIFCLCGCDFYTMDTAKLLTPPELSGELAPIAEVIKRSAGDN